VTSSVGRGIPDSARGPGGVPRRPALAGGRSFLLDRNGKL